jgi:hypothetical protein
LFAISFSAIQRPPAAATGGINRPGDPALAQWNRLLDPVKALPKNATARERMETLALVADTVHVQSHTLARESASSDDLRALASWYRAVLEPQMIAQAQTLSSGERRDVLSSIASQLDHIQEATEKVAAEVTGRSADALKDIAAVARDTSQQLRGLIV